MSRPKVSIVTPSYNQAAFLEETIVSVLEQDYPDVEYIVVDDGSTDGSLAVIERYADRLAWWTTQPNAGQVAALNRGFARATGDLLGWINSDDTLLPHAISTVVAAMEASPDALLVYGDNTFIDPESKAIGHLPAREFDVPAMLATGQNHVPQPGSLFRREAYERFGPLNEQGYYFFDFEFVVALGQHGRVVRIPETLATYRIHPESKSVSAPVRKARDQIRFVDTVFARDDLAPETRAVERRARGYAYVTAGEYFYAGLEPRLARRYLVRGARVDPTRLGGTWLSLLAKTLLPTGLVRRLRARRGRPH